MQASDVIDDSGLPAAVFFSSLNFPALLFLIYGLKSEWKGQMLILR